MKKRLINLSRDKIIKEKIGKFEIYLYKSHQLVKILKEWPEYSANLGRLVSAVKEIYPDMQLLDIGANVGDSVALVRSQVNVPIICIEGYEKYYELLQKNVKIFENVQIFNCYLGKETGEISVQAFEQKGSLLLKEFSRDFSTVSIKTLDDFMSSHPFLIQIGVIKIDTDGFDLDIISGGKNFIKKAKPVIFFELDIDTVNIGEDQIFDVFELLYNTGYHDMLFYDNYGRALLSTVLTNKSLVKQLIAYTKNKKGRFEYFDLCLFHKKDAALAEKFITSEINRNLL